MAIDCAVPRREEDMAPSHSQASITRGLPSIPSIASLHTSPGHAFADAPQGFCDMQVPPGVAQGGADGLSERLLDARISPSHTRATRGSHEL